MKAAATTWRFALVFQVYGIAFWGVGKAHVSYCARLPALTNAATTLYSPSRPYDAVRQVNPRPKTRDPRPETRVPNHETRDITSYSWFSDRRPIQVPKSPSHPRSQTDAPPAGSQIAFGNPISCKVLLCIRCVLRALSEYASAPGRSRTSRERALPSATWLQVCTDSALQIERL